MDAYLLWAVLGFLLVISELVSGTFYLFVIGIAFFGAALAAWLGQAFAVQAVVFVLVAAAGCAWIWQHRKAAGTEPMRDASAEEAMAKAEALALRVLADRLEHKEAKPQPSTGLGGR